tara:strand:+ start:672 stop:776 length:105 start_codon:yes stop_codon:yes gene_type:complete
MELAVLVRPVPAGVVRMAVLVEMAATAEEQLDCV